MLKGYKTYIVAAGFILFAIGGYITGQLDTAQAIEAVLMGLAMFGLRSAIGFKK
jgi:hypothetical protein